MTVAGAGFGWAAGLEAPVRVGEGAVGGERGNFGRLPGRGARQRFEAGGMTATRAGIRPDCGLGAPVRVGEGAVGVSGAISGGSRAGAHANASRPAA